MSDWYYAVDGVQKGPISESDARQLSAETLVWKEGMNEWKPIGQIPGLVPVITPATEAPPPFRPASTTVAPAGPPPVVCAGCKSPSVVHGFSTPLCQPCRETLVKAPVPMWLRISMGIVAVIMIYSAAHLPRELCAGIDFDRGESADAAHDFKAAEQHYKDALAIYPDSCDVLANLALVADAAGDKETVGKCMDTLVAKSKTSDAAKMALNRVAQHWMNEGGQK